MKRKNTQQQCTLSKLLPRLQTLSSASKQGEKHKNERTDQKGKGKKTENERGHGRREPTEAWVVCFKAWWSKSSRKQRRKKEGQWRREQVSRGGGGGGEWRSSRKWEERREMYVFSREKGQWEWEDNDVQGLQVFWKLSLDDWSSRRESSGVELVNPFHPLYAPTPTSHVPLLPLLTLFYCLLFV